MTDKLYRLTDSDVELIERLISKSSGDMAEGIGRAFEFLETRVFARIAELEDKLEKHHKGEQS